MKTEINDILDSSFKEYADYVNFHRAIPHFYDGNKPVARRILYTMYENGWLSTKPFVKVARISGQVMGIYHPHGNSSIEGALVRMAQSYHHTVPLIQGEGNFGDGLEQGAAAARYIEAKLSPQGDKMFHAIKKDTIPWVSNYDNTTKEPEYLPVPYPNLLASPTLGIGVGKMVSIPSHNLEDIITTTKFALENEHFTTEELLSKLKGPDFSCGCDVVNKNDFAAIYKAGKGSFRLRAKFRWEGNTLIISNFPYGVSASKVEKEVVENHGVFDYCDVINTTARQQELRLIFRKQDDEYVKKLCWNTSAENTFSFQFRAIDGEEAKIFSLQEFFMKWRKEHLRIMKAEFVYDLDKAKYRQEQLNGIVKALDMIDLVIKWIKESANRAAAKAKLMENGFSEIQCDYILNMKLSSLANAEIQKVRDELEEVEARVEELTNLVESPAALRAKSIERIGEHKIKQQRTSSLKDEVHSRPKKVESTTFYARQKGDIVLVSDEFSKNSIAGDKDNPVYAATYSNHIIPIKSPKDAVGKGMLLSDSTLIHISEDGLVKLTEPAQFRAARKAKATGQTKIKAMFQGEGWLLFTGKNGEQVQFHTSEITPTGRTAKGRIGVKGAFASVELKQSQTKGVKTAVRYEFK